jgi:hypothetical protein
VGFGHPSLLVFSAQARIAQILPLGIAIPEDHPAPNRYLSTAMRVFPNSHPFWNPIRFSRYLFRISDNATEEAFKPTEACYLQCLYSL